MIAGAGFVVMVIGVLFVGLSFDIEDPSCEVLPPNSWNSTGASDNDGYFDGDDSDSDSGFKCVVHGSDFQRIQIASILVMVTGFLTCFACIRCYRDVSHVDSEDLGDGFAMLDA